MSASRMSGVLLAVLLTGCTAPQTRQWLSSEATISPARQLAVPFFAQEIHQCGPAALASMLQASGAAVTPEMLLPQVYTPGRQGSLAVELVAATRRHQRLPYVLPGRLEAVIDAVNHGLPVLVLQNNGLAVYPLWHFAVVTGVDMSRREFRMHSGRTRDLRIGFSAFERTWARSGYWALLVLDPGALPDWAEAGRVLPQLAALEKYGEAAAALPGYRRAAALWPKNALAWLGLANASVRLDHREEAESSFRQLAAAFPDFAPGFNNFADFLRQQGRAAEALPLAQRAVALQDTDLTRQTLREVEAVLPGTDALPGFVPVPDLRNP
ncbi:MAG TPA: PA2778 family cysteine peptidase [Fluviicoccus sp.]|nr:PA2778 family cysteine peptidase [Fluviicoccus sp.]